MNEFFIYQMFFAYPIENIDHLVREATNVGLTVLNQVETKVDHLRDAHLVISTLRFSCVSVTKRVQVAYQLSNGDNMFYAYFEYVNGQWSLATNEDNMVNGYACIAKDHTNYYEYLLKEDK